MAKFGDDRSRDQNIDTDMDFEELDRLSMDDPSGGSFGIEDDGGRSPSRATRTMVTESVKGAAKGAMSVIDTEVERNMPNLYTVKTELSDTYQDLKDVKDEISRQLQPMMISMENSARKILPRVSKVMPKSWYDKIKKTLDDRAEGRRTDSGKSKEAERQDLITSELSQLFEQQVEVNKHNEFEHHKEKLMDRAVSSTQFKSQQHALTRIYDATRSTELFHRTLHTAYMKKSLELKFKHLFVAQDTYNLLSKSMASFEGYFKGIVKNTGLPDVMKTQASDYIKQSRTQRYGTLMADYLSNARQMIIGNVKKKLKEIVDGFGMGTMALDTAAGAMEMMDDPMMNPGGMKGIAAGFGGQLLGKMMAAGPVRSLMEKISPFTSAIDTRLENIKTRAAMGMNNLRKRLTRGGGFFGEFLASLLPSISAPSSMSNDLLQRGEEAAVFDKATRMSIVEIIPGYLGKIWHSVEKLNDPNAKEKIYNIYKRDFTTVEDFQKDIFSDSRMSGNSSGQTAAVGRMIATVAKGNERHQNVLHGEELLEGMHDALSRFISNHAGYRVDFEPALIAEYNKADLAEKRRLIEKNTYISRICEGLDFEEFNRLVSVISSGMMGANGKMDGVIIRDIKNAIDSTRTHSDGMIDYVPWAREAMGFSRVLRGMNGKPGIINSDDTYNLAYVNARNSKIGSYKDVEGYRSIYSRNISDVYANEDAMAQKGQELLAQHSSLRWVAGKYNQTANWLRRRGKKTDDIELGPSEASTIRSKIATPSSLVKADLGEKFLNNAEALVSQDETKLTEVNELITDLNEAYSEIASLDIVDADKKNMLETVRKQVLRKHKFTVGDINGAKLSATLKTGKKKVAGFLDSIGLKGTADKVRGSDTAGTVENPEEWKKKHGSIFSRLAGGYDRLLTSMENMTPEQVEQQVAAAKQAIIDAPANMKKSDLVALVKGERKLRDILHERYPDSKVVQDFDRLVDRVTGSRGYKALMNASSAVGTAASHMASPYIERGKKKLRTWTEPVYTRIKAFSSNRINKFCAEHEIDPDLVRRARDGDEEAQEQLYAEMKRVAGDQWDSLKAEFSKDKMMQRWASTRDFLRPENLAAKAGKRVGIFRSFINEAASGVKQAFSKGYSDAMGVSGEEGEGVTLSSIVGGESVSKAAAEDSSSVIRVVREFNASTSREHEGIADLIHIAINTLKTGVSSLPKDANDKRASTDEAMISRKRYGLFGKGGSMVASASKQVGRGALWAIKKTGKLYAATYTGLMGAAGALAKGVIGGVSRVGGWLANTAGLNPYVDIYVKGQEGRKPVLTWRKQAQGKGVYYGVLKGNGADAHWEMSDERVKSSPDIVKRGVPIFDPETGNMLINEEDLQAGLWAAQSGFTTAAMGATAAIRSLGDIYSASLKGLGAVANTIAQGIFGTPGARREKYVDIYLKDQVDGHPLVTRRQQIRPGIFFVEDGKRVERSSDIHSPVMDKKRNVLIDEQDIEHGLVDVDNKPLGSSSGGHEGLLGKAFNLGGIIAKGIFGKTGLKIVGGALSGIGAMYKGLFDALLGGGKAIGRGFANIGARLFGFDSPAGFGNKAVKSITSRLDTIIELLSRGVAPSGGGGGSGGPSAPSGSPPSEYFAGMSKSNRGRRGYWRNGKFIPDRNGDSYELDGIDHPGGAAYGLSESKAKKLKVSDSLRANASATVRNSAKNDYHETTHELEPEGGAAAASGGDGIGVIDALLMSQFVPKSIKKKILRARRGITKKITGLKRGTTARLGKTKGSFMKGFKKGGLKGGLKSVNRSLRANARLAARMRNATRGSRLLARAGRFGKLGALGALAYGGIKGMFGGGAPAAAAETAAAAGSKVPLWAPKDGGKSAKAAAEAAEKTATKLAETASKSVPEGATRTGKLGKIFKFLAKPFAKIAGGVGTYASKVGGIASKVLGKAAAPLGLFLAGDAAGDARENAEDILGREKVSDTERKTVGTQAAMNEMSSGALLGLDHLILGKNVNNWIGDKLYDDENAAAKAVDTIDDRLGLNKFSIATTLADKTKDMAWYNPLKWGAKIADGATGTADYLAKGTYRITGGTTAAVADNIKAWWGNRETDKKVAETAKKQMDFQTRVITSLKPSIAGYDIGVGYGSRGAKTDFWTRLWGVCKGVMNTYKSEFAELRKKYAKSSGGDLWEDPVVKRLVKEYVKDHFPPTDKKGRLAFFMKLYKAPNRGDLLVDRDGYPYFGSIFKSMFGISDQYYAEDWDRARSALENKYGMDGQKVYNEVYGKDSDPEPKEEASETSGPKTAEKDIVSSESNTPLTDREKTLNADKSETSKTGIISSIVSAPSRLIKDATSSKNKTGSSSTSFTGTSLVTDYVKSIGGQQMIKTMKYGDFSKGVEKFVEDKLKDSGIKGVQAAVMFKMADRKAIVEYANAFGIKGHVRWNENWEMIDPATGQPVTLIDSKDVRPNLPLETKNEPAPVKTERETSLNAIKTATPEHAIKTLAPKPQPQSPKPTPTQESTVSTKDGVKHLSARDIVQEYVESIGGIEAVRSMRYSDFRKGCDKYAEQKIKEAKYRGIRALNMFKLVDMTCLQTYAGAFEIRSGKIRFDAGELIDPRTNKKVELSSPIDRSVDTSLLAPSKQKDHVSPNDLAVQSQTTAAAGVEKITGAINNKSNVAALTDAQIKELYANSQNMYKGYMKFADSFSKVIGPNGMNVNGMRELTAATLMQPEGGTTEIIREVPIPQVNGLDLASRQC